jgi:hypothetical protein
MYTKGYFPGGKATRCETDHSLYQMPRLRMCEKPYLHSPTRLHGVVLY